MKSNGFWLTKVFIEHTSWPGKVKIRPYNTNITIWTVREAIE